MSQDYVTRPSKLMFETETEKIDVRDQVIETETETETRVKLCPGRDQDSAKVVSRADSRPRPVSGTTKLLSALLPSFLLPPRK